MLELDLRTLLHSTLLFSLIFGIGLYGYTRKHTAFNGIGTTAIGLVGTGLGWSLLGARDLIGDFFSIVVANLLILGSLAVICRGVLQFYMVRLPWATPLGWLGLALLAGALWYWTFEVPAVNPRILAVSTTHLLFDLIVIVGLWRVRRFERLPVRGLLVSFAVVAGYHVFRLIWTLSERDISNFMHPGTVHAVAVLLSQLLVLLTPFFIILSASDYLESELRDVARRDPLTGAMNRRALEEEMARDVARARRTGSALAVIICDIDHFKNINDNYGHQYGDEVLRSVAELLTTGVRETDTLARVGGEEFVILLPASTLDFAAKVAEKLRQRISELALPAADRSPPLISASFGVTEFVPLSGEHWDDVYRRADQAMYEAKRRGRNRVEIWSEKLRT